MANCRVAGVDVCLLVVVVVVAVVAAVAAAVVVVAEFLVRVAITVVL